MAKGNVAANSPLERTSLAYMDQKLAMAKRCSHGNVSFYMYVNLETIMWKCTLNLSNALSDLANYGVQTEGVMAGAKAAVVATVATAIPTVTMPSTNSIFFLSFNFFVNT